MMVGLPPFLLLHQLAQTQTQNPFCLLDDNSFEEEEEKK
jgi:hypothetical protein